MRTKWTVTTSTIERNFDNAKHAALFVREAIEIEKMIKLRTPDQTLDRDWIEFEGLVVEPLFEGSRASGTLYDRYVRDIGYCDQSDVATSDWVPAKDGSCRLYNCQEYEPLFDATQITRRALTGGRVPC